MFPLLDNDQLTANLQSREILIVGGTEGIGGALTHELARHGAYLTVTGSSDAHVQRLPKDVNFVLCNTSTMRGAQELGSSLLKGRTFDTVVFAGGFVPRPLLFSTVEGKEEDLHTSYLSRFIILNELVKNSAFTGRKRVYLLAYPGDDHMMSQFEDMWFDWTDYKDIPFHLNTVLFNDALVKEGAKRFPDMRVFGVNPGFLSKSGASDVDWARRSYLQLALDRLMTIGVKSTDQYVRRSLVQILAAPDLDLQSGIYISEYCEELPPKRWMSKESHWNRVWEHSEKLVGRALG